MWILSVISFAIVSTKFDDCGTKFDALGTKYNPEAIKYKPYISKYTPGWCEALPGGVFGQGCVYLITYRDCSSHQVHQISYYNRQTSYQQLRIE